MNRTDVLAMLDDQFQDLRRQLDLQLHRMAQIQMQLDQIHGIVKVLRAMATNELDQGPQRRRD